MAGIGISLNKIYSKNTIGADLYGFAYSAIISVAPMFVIIGVIIIAEWFTGFSHAGYASRELFADTVLYIFIFSLLTASPFNAVLSRYLSDTIFEERYEDILPCFYAGMTLNMILGFVLAVGFCLHEHFVGGVPIYYVFTGFCGFMSLLLVFYCMLYLSIAKDYAKISLFYSIGMGVTLILDLLFVKWFHITTTYALLLALVIGFMVIASLEIALIHSYFRINSRNYRPVFHYFRIYWQLIVVNFLYTAGLYVHNMVYWFSPMHNILVKSFYTMTTYDMASCLAMFTSISATIIFISRIEMHFHERYKAYSEAVIGGRFHDIETAKNRMFSTIASEIMSLARIQFMITIVVFLLCLIFLPRFGFAGETLRIYHCLSVGYFIMFLMYSVILFLYYFNDLTGALWTAGLFFVITLVGTIFASHASDIWYGLGLVMGSLTGFTIGYFRLRWMEKHIYIHTFCKGSIMKKGNGPQPDNHVYHHTPKEMDASA